MLRFGLILLALATGAAAVAQPGSDRPLAIDPADPALAWGPCPPIFATGCQIAVLHGDPAKPNADIFLRIAPGTTLPPHTHSSAERMMLATGELRVRYQGNAPALLRAGHYAYGPTRLPHEATCVSKSPCTLFIAFEGPVDAELSPEAIE